MKKQVKSLVAITAALLMGNGMVSAQFSDVELQKVQQIVISNVPAHMGIGAVKAKSLELKGDTVVVNVSENFRDIPFTPESIATFKSDVKTALGEDYKKSKVALLIAGDEVEKYFVDFDKKYARKHAPFIVDQDANRRLRKVWTAISSPLGKAMAGILKTASTVGSGNAPVCSRPWKICTPKVM